MVINVENLGAHELEQPVGAAAQRDGRLQRDGKVGAVIGGAGAAPAAAESVAGGVAAVVSLWVLASSLTCQIFSIAAASISLVAGAARNTSAGQRSVNRAFQPCSVLTRSQCSRAAAMAI